MCNTANKDKVMHFARAILPPKTCLLPALGVGGKVQALEIETASVAKIISIICEDNTMIT